MRLYFYKGKPFSGKSFYTVSGINQEGNKYWKIVLPFGVFGFTYK